MAFLKKLFRRRRPQSFEGLRERQERFRDLVEKNNRVLELIADAGEKLGGEYIFDIQYIRTLAAGLAEAARGAVYDLNAMTGNRYSDLVDAVERIEAEVQAALESRVIAPRTGYVIPFAEIGEELSDAVGDKMARLGRVRRELDCAVPEGFVVSAFACRAVLDAAGITGSIEEWFGDEEREWEEEDEDLAARAALLRERVLEARLPADVEKAIRRALRDLERKRGKEGLTLAVRSSALGEDGDVSFAGQYLSVLGVGPDGALDAYRKVLASMYSPGVIRYRLSSGFHPVRGLMAVGFLEMVPARAAGVAYTLDPVKPEKDALLVAAARGLGKPVVDGTGAADRFEVSRNHPHGVLARTLAEKEEMLLAAPEGGVRAEPLESGEKSKPALSDEELAALAATALEIEKIMRCAQDIEWALDGGGRLFILQARPLRIPSGVPPASGDVRAAVKKYPVLLEGRGEIACRGIGCGPVCAVSGPDSLRHAPDGAVLVARNSTPWLASSLARAAAVITDIGSATGHLAAVARELRVPAIVDAGDALRTLAGAGMVTVDAEEGIVYRGIVKELLHHQLLRSSSYVDTAEFRLLRNILKRVAPLKLKDPAAPGFSAASCSTYHDVIRFAHEKAVEELTRGSWIKSARGSRYACRLQLDAPLDLVLVDLGGGVKGGGGGRTIGPESVTSKPLEAVLEGLMAEGVWATGPADMDLDGFLSSATRSVSLTGPIAPPPQQNLAIVSRRYLNLNLKLGYHYNIVDSYLTDQRNDNFIYFRFAGGVTETARRSRRAELLRRILERSDFVVELKGDLVIGRIKKIPPDDMVERLKMIGKLIGFTRQLDIFLKDDSLVEQCVQSFLEGRYNPFGS